MKIVTIVGARPQFVKAATLSRAIKQHNQKHSHRVKEVIVHTGQHFDQNMSDVFFEQMNIPRPDYDLDVNGLSHGAMTGQMLEKIEKVLIEESPDCVVLYGDTNSTLAGALAAKKLHQPVAHVESGLRSFNNEMPEEINRILADRISDLLFCPTEQSVKNLANEGFETLDCKIHEVGDVMLDAALFYKQYKKYPNILSRRMKDLERGFALATIHRAENTDDLSKLRCILNSFVEISKEVPIVFPVHPRTKKIVESLNIDIESNNLVLIPPVGYFEIIALLDSCSIVMTDSGGMQKEAYFFKKPCLTLRDQTEWVELIEAGVNKLTEIDQSMIVNKALSLIDKKFSFSDDLYGTGNAANLILEHLLSEYK